MICPFMSNPKDITDTDGLYPCIGSCELRINGHCAFAQIAKNLKY